MNDFSLLSWPPGTRATLTNVPWNADYRDIVYFDKGQAELDRYIDSRESSNIAINDMSYARPGQPIRINVPYGKAMRFNYIRVSNPAQAVPGDENTAWYYFITEFKHVAPNVTEIYVQLDVIQSFIYQVKFGRCYVEAGHIGVANGNRMARWGRDFLTVPEGFDLGAQYQVRHVFNRVLMSMAQAENNVLIMSTVDLTKAPGDVSKPNLTTAPGGMSEGVPNGASLYVCDDFLDFMFDIQDYPWISQGIIGIWSFPRMKDNRNIGSSTHYKGLKKLLPNKDAAEKVDYTFSKTADWRKRDEFLEFDTDRYRYLDKFRVYPYSFFELTFNNGAPVMLKPELINGNSVTVSEFYHYTPPNQKIALIPSSYNGYTDGILDGWSHKSKDANGQDIVVSNITNPRGEFMDVVAQITNFPSMSLVNDSYAAFLAGNANSIAYQYDSADWSQQKALTGNNLAADQASNSMALQSQQAAIGINAANQQTALANSSQAQHTDINNKFGIGTGVVGGAMSGGLAGAAMGLLGSGTSAVQNNMNMGIDQATRTQSQSIANAQTTKMLDAQLSNGQYMRDSNKQYADFAAKGDYRNAIAGINAKVQDAKLMQPTTSGQLGGELFNLGTLGQIGYMLKFKTLDNATMTIIGEHWLRYGYAVNRYFNVGKKLHCMTRGTYWKMAECVITAAPMPETFKQTIRGVFEKGVTVWRTPEDIGVLDWADNEPMEGVKL